MNYEFFHDLTFDVLYACLFALTFLILERSFYYFHLALRSNAVAEAIRRAGIDPVRHFTGIAARDVISQSMIEYIDLQKNEGVSRSHVEDLSSALFLHVDGKLNARLWVLDTIVTAAPLLGLLGTILGIMETFAALSQGGISDPTAVSRGIGTALIATAIGIGTALYGLVGHNVLHRQAEHLSENFKGFLLRTTM